MDFNNKLTEKKTDIYSLAAIFIFEFAVVLLILVGVLPREFSWAVTVVIIFYIASAKINHSLHLVIISIPLYIALPVSPNFDTLVNWRIIFIALALVWVLKEKIVQNILAEKKISPKKIKEFLEKNPLYFWLLLFLIFSIFSLIGASEIIVGIKKILFLLNIFIIFFIVKNTIKDKESFIEILKMVVFSGTIILAVAYLQLIATFFYGFYQIWQFWAGNIITALYGQDLGDLLSYSNTWFSYYAGENIPTLRMFSIFPDSHSFALFNIILLPFTITLFLFYKKNSDTLKSIACFAIIIASLFAIIFSGSRGAWVSAVVPLVFTLLIVGKTKIINMREEIRNLIKQDSVFKIFNNFKNFNTKLKNFAIYIVNSKLRIILSTILLFFILFPFSSIILKQTQIAEWKRINNSSYIESSILSKRIISIIDFDETSNKGRIEIWKDALASIKKHPILGVGIGNFPIVIEENISAGKKGASAHNLFLDIFSEMGILGLLAFLGIFYQITQKLFAIYLYKSDSNDSRENFDEEIYKIFALSFAVYLSWILGYAFFDVVLFNDKVLTLFIIALGLLYGIKKIKIDPLK